MMQRKFNYLQSIPGVFVPHPSPLPGTKRQDVGADGSSPTDGGPVWPGSRDQNLINELFPKSTNTDPYRIHNNAQHAKQQQQFLSSGVLGIKRPPENDNPLLGLTTGRENGFLSPGGGLNFNSSPRFDSRQSNVLQPECPSPPKALNTGQNPGSSISLLPSMSSLHNLLSKLPSVTASESSAGLSSSSPSRLSLAGAQLLQQQQQQQVLPRQPISPSSSTDSPRRGMPVPCLEDRDPSSTSPSPSRQQQHTVRNDDTAGPMSTSPQLDHNAGGGRETCTTSGSQQCPSSRSSEFVDSRSSSLRDHHHGHRAGSSNSNSNKDYMGPASKDKLTSFLDSFDQDSLTDLGLNDDLENSETYNSFLNEII